VTGHRSADTPGEATKRRLPLYAFLTASAVSLVGNNITLVAVPWFVLVTTGSAVKTGTVGFFTALPLVVSGLFGGTLVDRVGHRRMSIVADLASGVTVALIPLLYATVGLRYWQLLLLVFAGALLDVPGNTARYAMIPDLATSAHMSLERANAWQQMIHRGGMLVGPALAGVLIAWLGAAYVLWVDAATFMLSAALFLAVVPPSHAVAPTLEAPRASYVSDLKAGFSYLRADRLIRAIVVMVAITNFLDAPAFAVLLPVYARETVGTATALGFMVAAFGAGAIVSALTFGAIGDRLPRRTTFITLFALNPIILTVAQERVPREMRGRIFGLMVAVAYTAVPIGMILAGYAAEVLSVTTTLLIIAILYVTVTTVQLLNPALRQMDHPRQSASPDLTQP
jgi:MFS family permease